VDLGKDKLAGKVKRVGWCPSLRSWPGLRAPFLGGISGRGCRSLEIPLRHQHADLVYRKHGLLRPLHVETARIAGRPHYFFEISGNARENRFGLRAIASMQVYDQIANARHHVRRV
jgi:hypothetical protein